MRYIRLFGLALCTTLLLLFIHSCSQNSALQSEPQTLGNGTIRSFVELDDQNQPKEIGVILTETALTNLPHHDTEIVLELPSQASTTAFTHVGFDWRTHGHDPSPIYGSPHFDVHFYTLTPEEREAITLVGPDQDRAYATPEADLIPTGYVLAPKSAEPRMGAHWIDPTSAEFQGAPHGFTHTFIYGFYNGEIAFAEPMVTLDFLNSQQNFTGAIAVPKRYTREGSYPTGYSITYNPTTKEHIVSLTGLNQPQPQS